MNNKNLNQNNFKKIKIEENLQEIFFFKYNHYSNIILYKKITNYNNF